MNMKRFTLPDRGQIPRAKDFAPGAFCEHPRAGLRVVRDEEAARASKPGKLRLGHVHLKVRDLSSSLPFYREILGLNLTERVGRFAFLALGEEHHSLALEERGQAAPPSSQRALGVEHIAFEAPDRRPSMRCKICSAPPGCRFSAATTARTGPWISRIRTATRSRSIWTGVMPRAGQNCGGAVGTALCRPRPSFPRTFLNKSHGREKSEIEFDETFRSGFRFLRCERKAGALDIGFVKAGLASLARKTATIIVVVLVLALAALTGWVLYQNYPWEYPEAEVEARFARLAREGFDDQNARWLGRQYQHSRRSNGSFFLHFLATGYFSHLENPRAFKASSGNDWDAMVKEIERDGAGAAEDWFGPQKYAEMMARWEKGEKR